MLMAYNIEVSFCIFKNSNVTEVLNKVRLCAEKYLCEDFYGEYEYENKYQQNSGHCIITVKFSKNNLKNMIEFLNNIMRIINGELA